MSAPVARSAQSTHATSVAGGQKRPRPFVAVQRGDQLRPVATRDDHRMAGPSPVAGPGDTRGRARAAASTRRTTAAPMSGVSTVITTAYSADPDSSAEMPARSEALIPSAQSSATTGRAGGGHVDDRGAQDHDDVVAAAVIQRRNRRAQPSPPSASTFGMPYRVPAPPRGRPATACHVSSANCATRPCLSHSDYVDLRYASANTADSPSTRLYKKSRFKIEITRQWGVGSNQVEFTAAGYVIDVQGANSYSLQRWALRTQGLELLT